MRSYEAHPCAWQLAYNVVDGSKPGSISKHRTAMRVLDAIAEKAHPDSPWPNPWAVGVTPEARAKIEADTGRTFDLGHRISVGLSPEQAEYLKESLTAYLDGAAPAAHGRIVLHLLDAMEAADAA